MRDGMRRTFSLAILAAAGLTCSISTSAAERQDGRCQAMSGAYKGVQYCQVPIHALLANPESYDGKAVATFGYLLHEGGRRDVIGPAADALRRIDFIACVDVDRRGATYEDLTVGLAAGVYFVMIQGKYKEGAVNGACVGSFSDVYISRISKVLEND